MEVVEDLPRLLVDARADELPVGTQAELPGDEDEILSVTGLVEDRVLPDRGGHAR
ncbi:hypothetical protein ACFT8W_00125 [Streptomyces hygroscopicus]|uniref:hypothetical protein n=1 Tax=Streptomyces hygroscopicus TaxID=1912 RepID=UPI00363A1703